MIRKFFAIAMVIIMAIGLLAGCGQSSNKSNESSQANNSNQSENKVTTITMWGSWSGDQVKQIQGQLDAFNKTHPNIQVQYVVQQNLEQKLLTALAGGEVPDVLLWDRFQTALYAPKGALAPIDEYVKKDNVNLKDFYSEAVREMSYDGKLYGLPMAVDNRSLFYNKKLFQEVGIQNPPTTWAELEQDAKKLTVWKDGKLARAGLALDDVGLFNMWILQAGGHMLTPDGTKTAFNSQAGLDVLNFWHKLIYDDKVYVNGFTQGLAQGEDPFVTGKVAMKFNGPWALADYKKYGKDLDFGIVPPPAGPNGDKGTRMGGFGLAIASKSAHKDQAWEFIKWWTTIPENGVNFAKISGWIPANMKAANDPYFTNDPYYKAFIEAMNFAKIRPPVPGYSDVEGKALIPDLQLFLLNKMTAEQALKDAQQKGDTILQQNRQQ